MEPSPRRGRLALLVLATPAVVTVTVWGELSVHAHVGVLVSGGALAVLVLLSRSGEGCAGVGRRALPWVAWVAAALLWELVTLLHEDLPTLSDLCDPVLAHPPVRAAATVAWFVLGMWLLALPRARGGTQRAVAA